MSEKLDEGMLLWDGQRTVYCVKSVGQRQATIVAHHGRMLQRATLRGNSLPNGWRILDNEGLAARIRDEWKAKLFGPPSEHSVERVE